MWRLGHRPALDGIRGLAILLVVAFHATERRWDTALGTVGVTAFFTLSGFLITALLLEETDTTGHINWRHFYGRRARRLFPALAVLVPIAVAYSAATALFPEAQVWPVIAYVGNWSIAFGHSIGLLTHTWSLAIEEQFYLAWPIALWFARRWRLGPLIVAGGGIVTSVALRFLLWDGGAGATRVYYGSDTRADALLVGCLVAILATRGHLPHIRSTTAAALTGLGIAAAAIYGSSYAMTVAAPTLTPWIAAALIVAAMNNPAWLTSAWLRWFGRRSYGLYLWHYPILTATWFATGSIAAMICMIPVAVGIAELSWRYVEQPFLRSSRTKVPNREIQRSGSSREHATGAV